MAAFTFDTSGVVAVPTDDPKYIGERWVTFLDLSPFMQGYVRAAFESWKVSARGIAFVGDEQTLSETWSGPPPLFDLATGRVRSPRFSDLAPPTLAAMMADCEAASPDGGMKGYERGHASAEADACGAGAEFWRRRNSLTFKRFPPLTLTIGDDGLVYQEART